MFAGVRTALLSAAAQAQAPAAPVAPAPYNYDFVYVGDSRNSYCGDLTGTVGSGTGTDSSEKAEALDAWLGTLTGYKTRSAPKHNYGIGGQTIEQIMTVPRPGTATLGIDYVAQNPANNVVIWCGTNNVANPGTLTSTGTGWLALKVGIDYLTTPANCYNNQPKTIWLLNEIGRGNNLSGAADNGGMTAPQAAEFKAFSDLCLTLDYASGSPNARPRVIAIDTFNDPTVLDVSSGTVYKNIQGVLGDGLHQVPPGAKRIATKVASRINTLLATLGVTASYLSLPATGDATNSAAAWLNTNPLFTGSGGNVAIHTFGTVTNGTLLPSSCVLTGGNAGLTCDIAIENDPDGHGKILVLTVTGTASAAGTFSVYQTLNKALITIGDKIRAYGRVQTTSGSPSLVYGAALTVLVTGNPTSSNVIAETMVGKGRPASSYYRLLRDVLNSDSTLDLMTPLADTTGMAAFGASSQSVKVYTEVTYEAGAVNVAVRLSRMGAKKVTS